MSESNFQSCVLMMIFSCNNHRTWSQAYMGIDALFIAHKGAVPEFSDDNPARCYLDAAGINYSIDKKGLVSIADEELYRLQLQRKPDCQDMHEPATNADPVIKNFWDRFC